MAIAQSCNEAESAFRPVPTEYKGTLYRSKCEAMFARWIEIKDEWGRLAAGCISENTHGHWYGFIYEPKGTSVDGWTPDFLRWRVSGFHTEGHPWQSPILIREVVEYKPSRPTDAYVAEFGRRCERLNAILQARSPGRIDFCLYFGSVFNQDRGCYCALMADDCHEISYRKHDWLACEEQLVRETRFDLVSA